jgi:hypothetical protein
VIPRAAPTVAAVGQLAAAWVDAGLESAVAAADAGAAVADAGVAAGVDAGVAAGVADAPLEPPQALRVTTKTSMITANQRELLCDT